MYLRKHLMPLLLLLLPVCTAAQEATFQSFLNELKECNKVELSCFGDVSASDDMLDKEKYKQFLPKLYSMSLKEGFEWVKGSYIKHGDLIIAMLGIYCNDYDDIYKFYFVEHYVYTYMLVTYSPEGKIIEYKELGQHGGGGSGGDTYFARITPTDDPLTFRVEQGLLFDPTLLDQYKDLEYVVMTQEFTINPDGDIKEMTIGTPRKEYIQAAGTGSHKIASFEQFKSYFVKCEKPYVRDSLFTSTKEQDDLPVPDCFDFFPDTIASFAWPRYVYYTPCRYIETEGSCFFFVIEYSSQPFGVYPYRYYKILEFDGNGRFKKAIPILFHGEGPDGPSIDDVPTAKLITELKKYEHLWNAQH